MESIQEGFLEKVISVPSSEDTPANSAGSCPQGTRGGAGASWTLKKRKSGIGNPCNGYRPG